MLELVNESSALLPGLKLERLVDFLFEHLYIHPESYLGVTLVDKDTIRGLKEEWFGEDRAADVLSFPIDEVKLGQPGQLSRGVLGDIVICPEVAADQADYAGHAAEQEMYLLLVHGFLHLLGHDHAEAVERQAMFTRQGQLLREFFRQESLGEPAAGIIDHPDRRPEL